MNMTSLIDLLEHLTVYSLGMNALELREKGQSQMIAVGTNHFRG